MPLPILLALILVLVLEKEGTLTAEQNDESPEEKHRENVEGPKAHHAVENERKFAYRQLSVVNLHAHQKLVARQKGRNPEESVHNEVCLQN